MQNNWYIRVGHYCVQIARNVKAGVHYCPTAENCVILGPFRGVLKFAKENEGLCALHT